MPKLLLLRAFFETSNGGYYSPLHENGCASLLPIPDDRRRYRRIPQHLLADKITDPCTGNSISIYYPIEYGTRPLVHRDPRLDLGFYTGYYAPNGRLPKREEKRLGEGDYLLFIAGLAMYPEDFWIMRRRLGEIRRVFRKLVREGKAGVFIVGGLRVIELIDTSATGWSEAIEKYSFLAESPHYYRVKDYPVAVVGEPLIIDPIMIADSTGKPTRKLVALIGEERARSIARNNYRKSRVIRVGVDFEEKLANLI